MSFDGIWYNELGSVLTLSGSGGSLVGTYDTAVGDAAGLYPLAGRYNPEPSAGGQAMAWTVAWHNDFGNSHSVTAWSGQYQINAETGEEEIYTLWLLASEVSSSDDWQSTKVGQDTFTRTPPSPQSVAKRLGSRPTSHPK